VRRVALSFVLIVLGCAPAAGASVTTEPWPPASGPGQLFVHFGEEHFNDDDRQIFADRPFPFGDGANYEGIGPARTAADPPGASSHYVADIGRVRWIFLDNSCWGLTDCDSTQSPAFPDEQGNTSQLGFLERNAAEARDAGLTVFVVMHMPTRDPRDQSYIDPTTFTHVMGKNSPVAPGTPDNERFEAVAERTGVDGVFLGHIKGQFVYRGRGDVPYYIDGGAGGELYTEGPVGTDHGYWHGFRLVRVDGGKVTTDTVPIFVPGGIRLEGADSVRPAERSLYRAFGREPVFNDPAKVEALELRDPDPVRPVQGGGMGAVGGFVRDGGWAFVPVILLMLGGLMITPTALPRPRRRTVMMACAATGAGVIGTAGMSLASRPRPPPPRSRASRLRPGSSPPPTRSCSRPWPRRPTIRGATRAPRPRTACSRAAARAPPGSG